MRPEARVDRVQVLAAQPPGRADEGDGDNDADAGQHLHVADDLRLQRQKDDAAQHGATRQHSIVEQELQLRHHLGRERATQHVLRGIVQPGLQAVADDEQQERGRQDGVDGDPYEADQGEDRQREDRVLHAEPVEHPGSDE